MRDYRSLQVWRRAHQLVLSVYGSTDRFPRTAQFGLTSQRRRAAVAIPSNIAEGAGRGSEADFARFVRIGAGSVNEVEYQCLLAKDLGFIPQDDGLALMAQCAEVRRMLVGLEKKLSAVKD